MTAPNLYSILMKYTDIQILNTEFDDNFLLLYDNRTLLVGFVVKEILEYLQTGVHSVDVISNNIHKKHNLKIDNSSICATKEKLDAFLTQKTNGGLIRVFKLFNPNIINLKVLEILFLNRVFYSLLFISLALNIYFAFLLKNNLLNKQETIIWLLFTILILFSHEIGHSVSAQKYNINCKQIGVGIYLIFPIFYINLGEAWKLKKSKRILINLSGIYFQLIIGVGLIILNYVIENKIIIHLFFTNFIVILLNLNPFIKFDGYWILSDILNVKNLSKKSNDVIKNFFILNFDFIKNNLWINIYSFFKFLFLLFILSYVTKLLIGIVSKIITNNPLSIYDYLFSLILFTIIIKKIRKK